MPSISTAPFVVRTFAPDSGPARSTAPFEVRASIGPLIPDVVTVPFEVRRSRAASGGTSTTALAARLLGEPGFGW